MDAQALVQRFRCRLCGRSSTARIVVAEDGFCYHDNCIFEHVQLSGVISGYSISPVTRKQMGSTLVVPKTINCLIEKLNETETHNFCESNIADAMIRVDICPSEVEVVEKVDAGDCLARKAHEVYFGYNNEQENRSLGFELLVEAATDYRSAFAAYKLGSMYSAGVHGFKMDSKRAKRWLVMAKELSNCNGSLSPSELENVDCYLKKLQ